MQSALPDWITERIEARQTPRDRTVLYAVGLNENPRNIPRPPFIFSRTCTAVRKPLFHLLVLNGGSLLIRSHRLPTQGRYGPHKLDCSHCITGNSGISQPAEINITFLHITPNISDGIHAEFSTLFVFADSSKRSKSIFPREKFHLECYNVIREVKHVRKWALNCEIFIKVS